MEDEASGGCRGVDVFSQRAKPCSLFPYRPNWPEAAYLGVIWNKSRTNNVIDG